MVATRGIERAVDFVLGNRGQIDPATLRAEDWVDILQAAVERLPVNYLRGFQPINQILEREEKRKTNGEVPCVAQELLAFPRGIRANEVFLDCWATGDFGLIRPRGFIVSEWWEQAPRKHGADPLSKNLAIASEGHVLLTRKKKFYYLSVNWVPKMEWPEKEESPLGYPSHFFYKLHQTSYNIAELNESTLGEILMRKESSRPVACSIMHKFLSATENTLADIRGQYDRMFEEKLAISDYLDHIRHS